MIINSVPYDETNSSDPWLMKCSGTALMGPDHLLTSEYIWSQKGAEREKLLNWVFEYYRKKGYPVFKLTDKELQEDYQDLKNKNPDDLLENGALKNSNTIGLDAAKHFTSDLFLNARGGGKTKSCIEVFNNDELFKKVLKNRMGWNTSKEGGKERPYVFGINDKMITQGIRSSAYGHTVSHFKPLIAKYVYKKYKVKKTLDYSCGWGARCVAALSSDIEYYGIDPLTSDRINSIIKYFGGTGFSINNCSEKVDFNQFPDVDMAFSSPPYFNLEIYSNDATQSSNYANYNEWLEKYWKATVEKCCAKSKLFSFVAVEKVKKHELLKDMAEICDEYGELIDSIPIKTSKSHLSRKAQTKSVDKKTEHIKIYKVK